MDFVVNQPDDSQEYWAPSCDPDSGDAAFLTIGSLLLAVLVVPALGLAGAGLTKRRSALSMIAQAVTGLVLVSCFWFVLGFSLVFGPSKAGGLIGAPSWAFLAAADLPECLAAAPTVPLTVFFLFQMAFAVFATVLPTMAWADRTHYSTFLAFVVFFPILVYVFVAHWLWNAHGWLAVRGAVDFGGGLVVLTTAGVAGFLGSIMVRKRARAEHPGKSNLPLYVVGALFVWLGWYVFQAGSAYSAGLQAGAALLNTHLAASGGSMTWLLAAYAMDRHWHTTELATGALAGVAGIAAGAGYVQSYSALVIGIVTSLVAFFGSRLMRSQFKRFDVLDVVSAWGVPGALGALCVPFFADSRVSGSLAIEGMFRDVSAGMHLLYAQAIAVLAITIWTAVLGYVLLFLIKYTTRLDLSRGADERGLDAVQMGVSAYDSEQRVEVRDTPYDQLAMRLAGAASSGNVVELDRLLSEGADPDARTLDGRSVAHHASAEGRMNALQLLVLKHGADVNALDAAGHTPLSTAITTDHVLTASWLRRVGGLVPNEGALVGQLLWAARTGNVATVTKLLRVGVQLNVGDYDGRTALMLAAAEGSLPIVEALLDVGADLGRVDRWGRSALDDARDLGHTAVANALRAALRFTGHPRAAAILRADAQRQATPPAAARLPGAGAVVAAAAAGRADALERAFAAAAQDGRVSPVALANAALADGRTPLHLAAGAGSLECVRALHARGARPNALDARRSSPLMHAIARQAGPVVDVLRRAGGTVVDRNVGHTLANVGAHGDIGALYRLAAKGVDLNTANSDGRTALHLAATYGHAECVNWLVRSGVSINAFDRFGHTALDDAVFYQRLDVAHLLRLYGGISTLPGQQQQQQQQLQQGQEGGQEEPEYVYEEEQFYYYLEEEEGSEEAANAENEYEVEYEVEEEGGSGDDDEQLQR